MERDGFFLRHRYLEMVTGERIPVWVPHQNIDVPFFFITPYNVLFRKLVYSSLNRLINELPSR